MTNVKKFIRVIKNDKKKIVKRSREVEEDIDSKIENLQTAYDVYLRMKKVREESETYYKNFLQSLKRGRFTSAAVKNALDALIQSREAELGTLIRYNISQLQLNIAKNDLFETYNIDIEKYIPKDNNH